MIRQPGAAGGFDGEAYAYAAAAFFEVALYVFGCRGCEGDGHGGERCWFFCDSGFCEEYESNSDFSGGAGFGFFAVVFDGGLDGVFCQYGAVDFDGRQGEFLRNFSVAEVAGFVQCFAFYPFGDE